MLMKLKILMHLLLYLDSQSHPLLPRPSLALPIPVLQIILSLVGTALNVPTLFPPPLVPKLLLRMEPS